MSEDQIQRVLNAIEALQQQTARVEVKVDNIRERAQEDREAFAELSDRVSNLEQDRAKVIGGAAGAGAAGGAGIFAVIKALIGM